MSVAYLFPGQGSQFVGMGKEHYESDAQFKTLVDQANDILKFDLKSILFEGPQDLLTQTENTQPAIFLHSVALYSTLDSNPDMVAGHSLGEFSALVASGAVKFEDALKIVRNRGLLMQKAGELNPGTMAAIIGMEDEKVDEICARVTKEKGLYVVPANYNCPGQLVISGYIEAVKEAVDTAKAEGARMATLLPVSGAFHSSLMKPALDGLKEQLESLEINTPNCPIYSNYTAKATSKVEEIRSNLLNQLLNPVKWTQTLLNMKEDGANSFVEVGPGKVLQGLVKRTLKEIEISGHQ